MLTVLDCRVSTMTMPSAHAFGYILIFTYLPTTYYWGIDSTLRPQRQAVAWGTRLPPASFLRRSDRQPLPAPSCSPRAQILPNQISAQRYLCWWEMLEGIVILIPLRTVAREFRTTKVCWSSSPSSLVETLTAELKEFSASCSRPRPRRNCPCLSRESPYRANVSSLQSSPTNISIKYI